MMKNIIIISIFIFIYSCQKDSSGVKSGLSKNTSVDQFSKKDNFDDFKKKDDESCESEEDLKKKMIPEKPKAFQLQGGEAGCDISELEAK